MNGQKSTGSVFMCRLCNQFSPSHSLLLAHCSQLHPQQECPDDIIIALQPLVGEQLTTLAESPVKRKRGRPKGSTKKTCTDQQEGKVVSIHPPEKKVRRDDERNKEEVDRKGEDDNRTLGLECRDCHRVFSNRRQILKHICLREEEEEEEEDNGEESKAKGGVCGGAEAEESENLDPEGADPNQILENSARPGLVREQGVGRFKRPRVYKKSQMLSNDRGGISKEEGHLAGNKKSVISVVLKKDDSLPGVSKMVPVEESSAGTDFGDVQAQSQSPLSKDLASESTTCDKEPKTTQEPSSNLTSTRTAEAAAGKGFQEYSIKQDATNLLQSHLKIFACEFCNKIFKFRHSLISHLRTHTQEKPFQCPHCDYASAIKGNLNVHLRKHTGEKFSCEHCPFNCLSPGHLKVHIERVHLKVKQHCSFCKKKYSDVKNLLKHMEKRHNLKDTAVYQSYQQLRLKTRQGLRQLLYLCPTCNRRFKNQLERERHMLVHGPQRPFACLLCDHAATKMAALAAHVRKHPFLYVCSLCDGMFVSSQRLKSHLQESHPELDQQQAFSECVNNSFYLMQPGGVMSRDEEKEDTERGLNVERREEQENEGRENSIKKGIEGEEWRNAEGEQLKEAADEDKSQNENVAEELVIEGQLGNEDTQEACHQSTSTETTTPSDTQEPTKSSDSSDVTAVESLHDNATETCTSADDKTGGHEENPQSLLPPQKIPTPLSENTHKTENIHAADEDTCTSVNTHTPSSSGKKNMSHLSKHTPLSTAPAEEGSQTLQSEKVSEASPQSAFQQVFSSLQKSPLDMKTFHWLRKIYGDLECQYCGKLFWYKVHYNAHVRTHTKEHLHYCSKCSYSSITKSSLKRHLIQKHSGLLLSCSNPGCKYSTPDKYKLQAHQRTHQEQSKIATCPVCHHSYPEHRLKHHIKTSHPDTLPGKGLMVKRAEKCPYCDSYFLKNSSDFQQHIWAHQGVKPYLCGLCDYAGRSRSNLKAHMNRHNKDRCHICDLCGKRFKSKVTLKSHRLSHTNEGKRFQCSQCDFTSVFKHSLLRHMEQHAEFKPFRCAHCHYSCNIAGPLKRHYNRKHPDQTYENAGPGLADPEALKEQGGMKCPECKFVYGTKWELNRHLSRHLKKKRDPKGTWEVQEEVEAQYVPLEDEEQLTAAHVVALQDNGAVNILQQITEFSSETHNAVTSMVAMAPGTVAVVEQVADEKDVSGNQLMVVNAEGDLTGDQVMVVEEGHGLEALTVLTQGENTHHYIVYVQEHTVEIN